MTTTRLHPARLAVALVLALSMSVCCCTVQVLAGITAAGPDAELVDRGAAMPCGSCCGGPSDECEDGEPGESDDHQGCGGVCCIKTAPTPPDWSPPVDVIGIPVALIVDDALHLIDHRHDAATLHVPAGPDPRPRR